MRQLNKEGQRKKFSIEAFRFTAEYKEVYMHCELQVCHSIDAHTRCAMGCLRQRREVRIRKEAEITRTATVSVGPIIVSRDHEDDEGEPYFNMQFSFHFLGLSRKYLFLCERAGPRIGFRHQQRGDGGGGGEGERARGPSFPALVSVPSPLLRPKCLPRSQDPFPLFYEGKRSWENKIKRKGPGNRVGPDATPARRFQFPYSLFFFFTCCKKKS